MFGILISANIGEDSTVIRLKGVFEAADMSLGV
jgi:hypothetical protein